MSGKSNNAGIYNFDNLNAQTLYIRGKKFQEYLDEVGSGLTAPELAEVKSLLEYLDITGLNSAWSVTNSNINETLRSAITALQTKTANLDTTGLTSPSVLTDANKNSALKTAIDTLITDLSALADRVTTEEGNVDALQTKTAFLDTTGLTQTSVLTNDNRNSVLKTAIDALSGTPGDVTALAARVTTAEGDIDSLEGRATSLEGRATSLEGRATAVEGRATTLEGKTRFTTVSNTYFDNNSGTAQPFGIPFGDFDGPTYPIGSFKMEVGPTLASGQGKSYFEMTHKNLVQHPNFPAGDIAQAQFSDLLRCAGVRSYYRKGATPGIYNLSNETFLQHTDENGDGRVTMKARVMRLLCPDTNSVLEIGRLTEGWSNPDIRIGGRGNQINIGSMQDDELAQGVGDVATKTRIYIGRRPTTGNAGDVLNSQLILRGDVWTGNLNFKDLAVTSPLSLETLISLLSPSGLPSFLFSSLFGGGLSIPKSDVVVMKGTVSKRGDIETSNALSIEKMSIINTSVGNLTPGFTLFFAQHDVTSTQLIGNNRTGVFQGEISLKNYNVASTGVDFAFAEENDKVNVLSIKGNSGILLHQGASSNLETLDIFNSCNGPIRMYLGGGNTRASTTYGGIQIMRYLEPGNLVGTGESKIFMGSRLGIDAAIASEAYQGSGFGQGKIATDAQLVIQTSTKVDTTRRQGVNVRSIQSVDASGNPVYKQSIINSDSISTPSVETESLKITANYGGSTTARLYKDSNNALYWNGALVTPSEAQTLGAVMTLGNTASTTLNMNSNGITNVASIQGWNVKDITAGTNITATAASGNYTIANAAPVQNVVAGSGGISVDINGTTATISYIGVGGGGGGGGGAGSQSSREEEEALLEIAAQPRKPNYWSQNWSIVDSQQRNHNDVYCSVDGKIIVSCSNFIRRSTDYGITWLNFNSVESLGQNMEWKTITGTSNGEKLFALILNENTGDRRIYVSVDLGNAWTILHTLPAGITPNRMRCSGDGRYIVLDDTSTKSNGAHYSSSNFGVTFIVRTLETGIGNGSTNGLCMSRSGAIQYMIFRGANESVIYRSFNYGVTWSQALYIPRFDNAVDKGYLTSLECCALGKFLYAPRFVAFNAATSPGYRTNNYGVDWSEINLGVNTATNFWVSGTGQFVVATSIPVSVPVVGAVNVFYSTDYGLSFASVSLGVPTSSSIAGSANGEILVIVSKNITENTFTGDGRIRLFRQGEIDEIYTSYPDPISGQWLTTNSRLALAPAKQLWASVDFRTNSNIYQINFFPNKIDMRFYNIEYEFEFFWERISGTSFPPTFLSLGLNNLFASSTDNQSNTRKGALTQWMFQNPRFSTPGTSIVFDADYVDRFYAGFAPLSNNLTNEYRQRTILKGELSLNFRTNSDIAFNTGQVDNSINERVIQNRFTCDNHTIEYFSPTQWGIHYENSDGGVYSPQKITGSAVWNASLGGVWTTGAANDRMDNGIHQLFFASTNTAYTAQGRPCQVKARIFRVRR